MGKITIEELIKKREQITEAKKPKRAELYIKSLDGTITIEEPSRETIVEAQSYSDGTRSDDYAVYQCVISPKLKSTELHTAYGCVEPIEIVQKIFSASEIPMIAKECLALAGFGDDEAVKRVSIADEVKN